MLNNNIIKLLFFFLFIILLAPKFLQAQEEITHYNINEFNGIWRNQVDTSVFYLFKNGKYLSFYIQRQNNKPSLMANGKYGFGLRTLKFDSLNTIELEKNGDENDAFVLVKI